MYLIRLMIFPFIAVLIRGSDNGECEEIHDKFGHIQDSFGRIPPYTLTLINGNTLGVREVASMHLSCDPSFIIIELCIFCEIHLCGNGLLYLIISMIYFNTFRA